jgi:hypothetical protein
MYIRGEDWEEELVNTSSSEGGGERRKRWHSMKGRAEPANDSKPKHF